MTRKLIEQMLAASTYSEVAVAITAAREYLAQPESEARTEQSDAILACDITPRPLQYPLSDYHVAMSEGPLHFTWTDKPHRLVYDLIAAVKYYAALPQPEQSEPVEQCTESDSWNCKYCRKTETCKALQDPRNFGKPKAPEQDALLRHALEALKHCCFASNDGTITDKDVAADAIYAIKEHLK